ncbi:TPA: hypothetical protein N0F65_009860 [Lagenidium giganteum]|uniref:Dynein light chain n=1 Tax=Lagenidium giganteum TaxID=4803 RepID=A0AAV2YNW1_9STRA|nr:TPA: hypothetical protein N0F65_009860 [Lagenidium giganteum]
MVVCGSDFVVSRSPVAAVALQTAAKKAVNAAARKSKKTRDFALEVQALMEQSTGVGWHVLVGGDFAVDVRYGLTLFVQRKGACVLLSSKASKMKVLMFRTTAALTPAPKEDHEALAKADGTKKHKLSVYDCDMDEDLQAEIVSKAQRLIEAFSHEKDADADIAQALKHSLAFSYGHTWQVIVSSSRDISCVGHHQQGTRADFVIDKFRVVVYRHAGVDLDTSMDLARMGNRVAMLGAALCAAMYFYFVVVTTDALTRCLPNDDSNDDASSCTAEEIAAAAAHSFWKSSAFVGIIGCTILASMLRVYRKTVSEKVKVA